MKSLRTAALSISLAFLMLLGGCSSTSQPSSSSDEGALTGQIYLYGELHAEPAILNYELERWEEYYSDGMRHLFIEMPYYTGEFLNLWMQAEDDTILEEIYEDWTGSLSHNPEVKEFYQSIKQNCPETVFHGTDVGHQYWSTGQRYLDYLTAEGLQDSENYRLAQENIEQAQQFYRESDDVYRENKMAENFIREFESLNGQSVMGIYGGAHTDLEAPDLTGTVPCMGNQLQQKYGENVYSESLVDLAKVTDPEYTIDIAIGPRQYTVSYFGAENLTGVIDGFTNREFWRVEDVYSDWEQAPRTGDQLPYDNYPMVVEEGEAFWIHYTTTDGSTLDLYYIADGTTFNGRPSTTGVQPEL